MLQAGQVIPFPSIKRFTYLNPLGKGGTGDAHLFWDETTDMLFAIKKYNPKDEKYIDEYYKRFVEEIKILFQLSHPNIVRIYNYYLFPQAKVGYLQMEYVDGVPIDKYVPDEWGKDWNDIFIEIISTFEYLESNNVLHRDIRPENILIDKNENVKIIDFGFGKLYENQNQSGNSVVLNWPVTELPEEIYNGNYNHRTEIYFIGKLFEHLLKHDEGVFKFHDIVNKMTKVNPTQRYISFNEISKEISTGILREVDFSENEKYIYQKFADQLSNHIISYTDEFRPINDQEVTLDLLVKLIRDSALEVFIQSNNRLIACFIYGPFIYSDKTNIEVKCVKDFYNLLRVLSTQRQKIVLNNIYSRLSRIRVVVDDEIPF